MNIDRPFNIDLKINENIGIFSFPKNVMKKDELVDIWIAPTIVKMEINKDTKKPILPIDVEMINEELYRKYNQFTYSTGKLNRLAELILDKLKRTVELYLNLNDSDELVERNKKCRKSKDIISKKDKSFEQLRSIFSCIIKTDKEFRQFPELDNQEKCSEFSTIFANYIIDRNCYVHGILYFLYPTFEPIMKVKIPNEEEKYVGITEKVLRDNLLTYQKINTLLSEINEVWQEKR
ncbi:hypothetical protein H0I29_02770 [Polaribacter sp. R2A056_3_33]|uniref:hypothetical protein n=1 Tax=Polaribacter sp. R2A056_3_33 TaxID=2745563 RepID=UPI001C4F1F7A|nr:hypothetical protein [Polaribacter sp. R2A056_3_33]QXP71035.1 hypothetical protein H0I29_02770 [Polaribacter sp. R2A056_3_33]